MLVIGICYMPTSLNAWGFAAHKRIAEASIHWLPSPLHEFFKSHHHWLRDHALDPDLRKHTVEGESERHYIDLDRYSAEMDSLKAWFPMGWEDAAGHWSEETLLSHGIGPWNAVSTYQRLVYAFDACDEQRILRHAVDLAHYIGDLHVPLHTTSNYNGQFTQQHGIHALWETQIPEMYMHHFNLAPEADVKLTWVSQVDEAIWNATFTSHSCLPAVFSAESSIRKDSSHIAVDAYIERGRSRQLMRSPEFVHAYHVELNGQVERQMASACALISSLWYSAWVDAGEPALPSPPPKAVGRWKKMLDWVLK